MSLKKEIINLLEEMAELMEFDGQNRFKVNAFRNGANVIRRLEGDIEEIINNKSIQEVKGIGKGLQQVIYEFYETGSAKEYEELIKNIPSGIYDILKIRGLGAKKVKTLYNELGIDTLEKLEQACSSGRIADLKGFGEKSSEKILEEIKRLKRTSGYMLLSLALDRSKQIVEILSQLKSIQKVELTGELRRIREIISQIELICQVDNQEKFIVEISKLFEYNKINPSSSSSFYQLKSEEHGDFILHVTSEKYYEITLLHTTGSLEFIQKMHDPSKIKDITEKEYFNSNNLIYVQPEMREINYFDLPEKLREQSDLSAEHFKGFFHFHTTYSDGNNSLPEMIDEVARQGFIYAAVCDHSKSAFYANGLKEDRILQQRKEIDDFNKSSKIKVYHGIESDILKDGSLDYSEDILSEFQFIVASIHSLFNLSEVEMTNRIIRAVENPYTDILAHPTGRLLLSRDGYKVNIKKVIDACVANRVAIEINANPHRLDLDWRNLYYAREKGCLISINPDAHSTEGVSNIEYGIMIARKAGVQPKEVLNCYEEKEFIKFINRKVKRKT